MKSVKDTALNIQKQFPIIDCIICNAGFGPDKVEFTSDGYELSFVANHLGHFVLVQTLMPNIEASEEGRIINVASAAYSLGKFSRFFEKDNKSMNALQAYSDSKLANLLFTKALSIKLKKATSYSLHPGVVNSGFGSNYTGFFKIIASLMRPFMNTVEKGASTSVFLATCPFSEIRDFNGGYFVKSKHTVVKHTDFTESNALVLWEKSKAITNS